MLPRLLGAGVIAFFWVAIRVMDWMDPEEYDERDDEDEPYDEQDPDDE